jgi:DNA-binding FadR family transcriptional regulator
LTRPPLGFLLLMQSHHRALLDAIERGEGSRAESVAREHWRTFSDGLQHVLKSACHSALQNAGKAALVSTTASEGRTLTAPR